MPDIEDSERPLRTAAEGVRPVHGGVTPGELRSLGLRPDEVVDFSASISPIGPPTAVWNAMRNVDLGAYPDPQCLALRETLSRKLTEQFPRSGDIRPESILVGNGSTEIIHLLARVYLSQQHSSSANAAFLLTPTYGEYSGACSLAGADIHYLQADAKSGFRWDLKEAGRRIKRLQPTLVFLCNPNNPTGVYLNKSEVDGLAGAAAEVGSLLIIDEAYVSFVEEPWNSQDLVDHGQVVIVRSLTKDYALTGLRLGYALAPQRIIARLARFQPDWSVNAFAQAAGEAVLGDPDYLSKARAAVSVAKERLTSSLSGLGFEVLPSAANFLLVRVGNAAVWRHDLARRGLFVRDCSSFGLREFVRIGARPLVDCERLVAVIVELLATPGAAERYSAC